MARLLVAAVVTIIAVQGYITQDGNPDMVNLIKRHGYPLEVHKITTEDSYVLTVYRIPHGKNETTTQLRGQPVILQHGILCSSAVWVLGNPNNSLGFILADAGYDVWLTNSRGNTLSTEHLTLKTNSKEYWDFSFHEMGYYDLPASIDYILKQTNSTKLYYVAHSQGSTEFWVMASTRPEYNEKVRHVSALAPITYLQHTKGTVWALCKLASALETLSSFVGMYRILNESTFLRIAGSLLCRSTPHSHKVCGNLLFLIAGYDSEELNEELLPEVMKFTPAGVSIKQLIHFGQLARTDGKFTYFDYGPAKNKEKYGQRDAPEYNLTRITVPVTLHYGENDWLAGIQDVKELNDHLPNSTMMLVPFKHFNHLDFMWAKNAWTLCFKDVLEDMEKY